MRVFVYGTLKSGRGNNRVLDGATLLGRSVLTLPYVFKSLGGFPGLVRTREPTETRVGGEVWEVNEQQFARCDRLEGFPHFYGRDLIQTPYGEAWTYVLPAEERYLRLPPGNSHQSPFWQQSHEESLWAVDNGYIGQTAEERGYEL